MGALVVDTLKGDASLSFGVVFQLREIPQSCATDSMCSIQHIDLRPTECKGD